MVRIIPESKQIFCDFCSKEFSNTDYKLEYKIKITGSALDWSCEQVGDSPYKGEYDICEKCMEQIMRIRK
jgi:hypothetical protein